MSAPKKRGAPKGSPGGPGRKPKPKGEKRVRIAGTVTQRTEARILRAAVEWETTIGRVLDRLAAHLPPQ
jgi:hypothetical protein